MEKPIKSRHGLTRCGTCRAHIQASPLPSETDCPFCGANLHRGGPRITAAPGRGGLLAASLLAFGLVGCGGGDSADPNTGTQEPVAGGDDGTADPGDDSTASGGDDYQADPAPDNTAVAEYGVSPDQYEEQESEDMAPSPRYGLAPMR